MAPSATPPKVQMTDITVSSKKEAILQVLQNSHVGLTSSEIRSRLLVESLKLANHEVLKELRILQSNDLVRLERGRWTIVATHKTNPALGPVADIGTLQVVTARSPQPISSGPVAWTPSKSPLLVRSVPPESEPVEDPEPVRFSGPWGSFRKLLSYYADCIRNDEGYEASDFMTNCGKSFFFLRQIGSWYPRAGQQWKMRIPLGPNLQNFMRNVGSLREDRTLLLGYPFHIWSKPDQPGTESVFVKPIFTYQLTISALDANGIEILCEDPWPEVNLDWLNYAIKEQNQQRAFLSICGLMDRGRGDESFGDVGSMLDKPDLLTLANGVNTFFGPQIREPLRPQSTPSISFSERPVSGIYNRAILMIGNRTRYTRSLLRELSRITACSDEELDKTALRFIFKSSDRNEETPKRVSDMQVEISQAENEGRKQDDKDFLEEGVHEGTVLETFSLNGDQRRAVASLVASELTVVTGPPGTGKSQVASAAMINARLRDQTAIFSSRNHKAIDAVVFRINEDPNKQLIIRSNSKEDPFLRFGFEEALTKLFSEEYDQNAGPMWEKIRGRLYDLLKNRGEWGMQVNKVQKLRDNLGDLEQQMENLSEKWTPGMKAEMGAVSGFFPRKSVERIENALKPLRSVNKPVHLIVRIIWRVRSAVLCMSRKRIVKYFRKYCPSWPILTRGSCYRSLCNLAGQIPDLLSAAMYCDLKVKSNPIENELKGLSSLEELVSRIKSISEELEKIVPDALDLDLARRTGLPPEEDREKLAALRSALRGLGQTIADAANRNAVQSALKDNSALLMEHFPLWAVTNLGIGSRFPLVGGLFDIAIIDEASQCDIPSAIPIMFRAKRVGVIGDPRQLSHITKIKGTRDALLRKRHGITQVNNEQRFSYPDTSLYDLFAQTNNVMPILLRDTYRSISDIAEYSNQSFYGGLLRVATAAERLNIPRDMRPGIQWTDVISEIHSAGAHGCFAQDEVASVVDIVKKIVVEAQFEGTVGVVTPFVQQKVRINDILTQVIPWESRRRVQLLVDTAHGFQGDERDVMILSLCCGPSMPQGSRGFVRHTANLMNVAVSRARAVLHVVGNRIWVRDSGIPHIARLAAPPRAAGPRRTSSQSRWYPHESPWEKVLFDALRDKGLHPEPQHPILGRRLDIALIREEKKIDIEVDGDRYHRNPDGTRKRDDVWRDIQLQGAGWKVERFWVYQLRDDLDGCVNKIIKSWR